MQNGAGSVDEKIQTCDFKKKQYKKLFAPLNKEVQNMYLLNKKWFDVPGYKDTFDYIILYLWGVVIILIIFL